MRIGEDPNKLKVDDAVILRFEPQAGVGRIERVDFYDSQGKDLYWCQFPKRSDGYFDRDDLHCDRLDGNEVKSAQMDKEGESIYG